MTELDLHKTVPETVPSRISAQTGQIETRQDDEEVKGQL